MTKKKTPNPDQLTISVLQGRARRTATAELEAEAAKRRETLKKHLREFVRAPVFDIAEARDRQDTVVQRLLPGGAARESGFELRELPMLRLMVQEEIGYAVSGERRLLMYSYHLSRADKAVQLLRFEYHPSVGQVGRWSSRHHLHILQLGPDDEGWAKRMSGLHLPVAEFLDDPGAPETVLPCVLRWAHQEFR